MSRSITPSSKVRVLVGDDQDDILTALSLLLKLNGFQTETVDSPHHLLRAAAAQSFDLILMDLNYSRDTTSGQEGLDTLVSLRRAGHTMPVIVMTAWGNVELAVEAMRLGASDFIQKPWDNQRLLATLRKQLDRAAEERAADARTKSELEIARHVQQKLFPQHHVPLETLDYTGVCKPAREVGGDYYDFFSLGECRFAGLLGDVSGKGVAAAMLMANLQACFRSQLDAGFRQQTGLLQNVNRLFFESTPPAQYVTLFYFEYDDQSRVLRFVNCGHVAPLLLRQSGDIQRLVTTGMVLGLFPTCSFEAGEVTLQPGDMLIAFTDGVTDLQDSSGEEFGEERFLALAAAARRLTAQAAADHLTMKLKAFHGTVEQFDDQTLIVLRSQ